MTSCIAVDLGASSYRIILNNGIECDELYRANDHIEVINDVRYWNISVIYNSIISALDSINDISTIDSIAINSWGCDFVYLNQRLEFDKNHKLITKVYGNCYINPTEMIDSKLITEKQLFDFTGIRNQLFNTINRYSIIDQPITFIASYLNYLLTNHLEADLTIASTSQMLDRVENEYNQQLLAKLKIDKQVLPPLKAAGKTIKNIDIERFKNIKVIFGAGHDTAYALNHGEDNCLILNIGSWIIIGTNLDEVIDYNRKYSYERGLRNKYKVVINQIGMNGFNKLIEGASLEQNYEQLYQMMMTTKELYNWELTNQGLEMISYDPKLEINTQLASYLNSLADLTVNNINQFITDINPSINTIYIVGGGSQNKYFIDCLLTKTPSNIKVEFGPYEATVMGNIKYQREILE